MGTLAHYHILHDLKTVECTERKSSTVEDHIRHTQRMIAITNNVQGIVSTIDHQQAFSFVKDTLPRKWKTNISVSGLSIETCSIQDFITFFAQENDLVIPL